MIKKFWHLPSSSLHPTHSLARKVNQLLTHWHSVVGFYLIWTQQIPNWKYLIIFIHADIKPTEIADHYLDIDIFGRLLKTTAILIAILLPAFLQNNIFIVIKYNSCCVWLFILFLVKYCLELSPGLWPVTSVRMIGGLQKVAVIRYFKKLSVALNYQKAESVNF